MTRPAARLWAWFRALRPWQQAAVVVVVGACVGLIAARMWDALGAFVAALFGLGGGGGAVKAGRRAVATRKAATAARGLAEAIAEAEDAHAESDAEADAAIAAARAAEGEALRAEPPADDLEPLRSKALEVEP